MAAHDLITLQGEHGTYQTRVGALDLMIQRYLLGVPDGPPASVTDYRDALQEEIRERQGDSTYTVTTVTEALMILAELHGHATN